MKINAKKFFDLAKARGFEAADLSMESGHSMSMSVFHGELENYSEENTSSCIARGIIDGKFGSCVTEQFDKNTIDFLLNSIESNAKLIETDDPAIIFKGSEKYRRGNFYDETIFNSPFEEKSNLLLEIEKKLYAYDKRINEVASVSYDETEGESILVNSYGLKLRMKKSEYSISAEITAKSGDEIRSDFKIVAGLDYHDLNVDEFVKDLADRVLSKLGSTQCKSKKYPVVLDPSCSAVLLRAYLSSANAEDIQKNSSLFVGKLHQQVASKKLTVVENPLAKNIFFSYFDDEGVATSKKNILKKGVLETYLYTLETAAKDGVQPTGNGSRGAGKASASLAYLEIKPGRKTESEIISSIKEGVYITDLEGLHAGLNARSGNFSLQAQGFMIKDGKISEPLSLITLAGNLQEMFMNIKEIAAEPKFLVGNRASCPSFYFKKMSVSGK